MSAPEQTLPETTSSVDLAVATAETLPAELTACWNEIGVYGTGSCGELRRFVHCRNCPVYSAAGIQVLERNLPPGYLQERSRQFAMARASARPEHASAVLFRLREEWLALPTEALQEVAEHRQIHSLPHRNKGVLLGLTNIRGELLICVSLGRLLDIESLSTSQVLRSSYKRLMVVNSDGNRFAFPAEEVKGPCRFHPQDLTPLPSTLARAKSSYTQGLVSWQDKNVALLDPALLFIALNRSLK